jgi:aspartyl/asparaginyl-tRNA synthetase
LTEKTPRITVKELHELMKKETGEDYTKHDDINSAEEKFICEYSAKNR